ncbi:hypothetical protein UlMin_024746 [Ulmus minor]
MKKKVLLISCVVGFLGLLSAATGFGAEATRIKGSEVEFISATQWCICCKRNTQPLNSNWKLALVCFVVSWFTFVIAFLLLLTGAALNDQHGLESIYFGNYYCYVVKPGVFAGGAVLSLASVTLGILYYLTFNSAKNSSTVWGGSAPNQGGIAMGQPQFPPQNTQDPVFVHEDTYMRRQFT